MPSVEKKCLLCGNIYVAKHSEINRRKYCSKECANNARKGKPISKASIVKMKKTCELKRLNKVAVVKHCSVCNTKIKLNSEYCVKHKHLTDGYKKARIAQSKTMMGKMPKNIMIPGKYGNIMRGYYDINGKSMFFRSKWEANYALYLDFLIKAKQIDSWLYEEDVFIFEKIISGTRTYRPDFKIIKKNGSVEYHEVKGYMDKKSVTKLKRMKKYYPEVNLIVIDKDVYISLKRQLGKIMKY